MIIHVEAEMVQIEESDPIFLCDWSVAAVRMKLIRDPDRQDHVKSDSLQDCKRQISRIKLYLLKIIPGVSKIL